MLVKRNDKVCGDMVIALTQVETLEYFLMK